MIGERPAWTRFAYALYVATGALCCIGLLTVYSADRPKALHQLAFMIVGFIVMGALTYMDYEVLRRVSTPIYLLNLGLLAAATLPGIGHASHGAQRWVSLGPLGTFQPSEPAKFVIVVTLAAYLASRFGRQPERVGDLGSLVAALIHIAPPFLLILLQPDLGTAGVLLAVMVIMLFVVGLHPMYLAAMGGSGLLLARVVLKQYQRERLLIFLHPETDPLGKGYSLIQSKTAIASGGLIGRGLFHGVMCQHHFVPEHHTDFIFAVLGEEMGLAGGLALLALYGLLLFCILLVAWQAKDVFGTLLCAGVAGMIGLHVMINVGMTIGVMPVTGIPLPLMSYGGSAILTNLAGLGLVGSVALHRVKTETWEASAARYEVPLAVPVVAAASPSRQRELVEL
ncbi:MAG: rod shape-determining protein RodA [Candidatus Xenobia bacterium]